MTHPIGVMALASIACGESVIVHGGAQANRVAPEWPGAEFARGTLFSTFASEPLAQSNSVGDCTLAGWAGELMDAGRVVYEIGASPIPNETQFAHTFDYEAIRIDPELLQPGETIAISAAGSDVPSFAATVEFPDHLAGIRMPSSQDVISLANELRVSWMPAENDVPPATERYISLGISSGVLAVVCSTDDDAGEIMVPQELLAAIGAGTHLVSLSRYHVRSTGVSESVVAARSYANAEPEFVEAATAATP